MNWNKNMGAKCKNCGYQKFVSKLLESYTPDFLGAPFPVLLENAVTVESCEKCGETTGHTIKNPQGLIAAVAVTRALDPMKLSGEEIKFLRKSLGWKAKDLAKNLDLTPEHLSRCENDAKPLGQVHERLLRAQTCIALSRYAEAIRFDPDEFLDMAISPVRDASHPLTYRFYLVNIDEIEDGDNWEREEEKAA